MSVAWEPTDELVELIDSLCRGDIEPDQFTCLSDMIVSDSSARSYYVRYLHMHAGLPRFLRSSEASNLEHATEADNAVGANIESHFPSPFPSLSTTHYPPSTNFVGGPVFSYMVATVVLCVMLLSAWAYKVTHNDNQIVNEPKSVPTSVDPRYELVAQITGMKDCRWTEQSQGNYVVSGLSLGREINLAAGLLDITYKTGAKVILEGPCSYKVDSLTGGFLRQGKLVARVEKKMASDQWLVARKKGRVESGGWRGNREVSGDNKPEDAGRGLQSESLATSHQPLATSSQSPAPSPQPPAPLFTVRTPTAVVTDLGTEFGVEVSQSGESDVLVFHGSVAVVPESAGSQGKSRMLVAGESAKVEYDEEGNIRFADVAEGDAVKSASYVRAFPKTYPRAYAKTVLADKPFFYWTFDESAGPAIEQVRNSPIQTLYPHGGAGRCRHADIDSGLALGRAADFSRAAGAFASRRMGRDTLVGPWAIEFWIQAVGGDRTNRDGQYILNVGLYGKNSYFARNNPAVIFDWPVNALENEMQLFSHNRPGSRQTHGGPILADKRWRHVVLVFYRNASHGKPPRVDVVIDGVRKTIDDGGFSAGFYLAGQVWVGGAGPDLSHPFRGRIDELAFYNFKDMTIEQIESRVTDIGRRHYEAARNAAERKRTMN